MDTKDQIESVVFHQTQCLNVIEDLKKMVANHDEDIAINVPLSPLNGKPQ